MLTGERPERRPRSRAFDIALTLHADHELNASTFAARVAAATLTDIHSAVVAGIGALKGPLHGGANAEVMKMLLELGADATAERVEAFDPRQAGAQGEDLRASATASTTPRIRGRRTCGGCRRSSASAPASRAGSRCRSASRRWSRREKKLNPNVDFYSASTYYTLGIPIDLYTPIFAVSRVSGWTAHVLEQLANNRLIRPRADYIGPTYPQRFDSARPAIARWPDGRPMPQARPTPTCMHAVSTPRASPSAMDLQHDPQFLHHRPHRPRQVDAGRPLPRDHRRAAGARDARPRSSTAWTWSASAASPSRRTRCA